MSVSWHTVLYYRLRTSALCIHHLHWPVRTVNAGVKICACRFVCVSGKKKETIETALRKDDKNDQRGSHESLPALFMHDMLREKRMELYNVMYTYNLKEYRGGKKRTGILIYMTVQVFFSQLDLYSFDPFDFGTLRPIICPPLARIPTL